MAFLRPELDQCLPHPFLESCHFSNRRRMCLRFLQFILAYNPSLSKKKKDPARYPPVRRDSLSPAISPLKYDFDAICEARILVRSGFQTEITDREPFKKCMSMHQMQGYTMKDLTKVPFTRADLPRKACSQRGPQLRCFARRSHPSDRQIFL